MCLLSGKRAPYIVVFIGKNLLSWFCYLQKISRTSSTDVIPQKLSRTSSNSVHNLRINYQSYLTPKTTQKILNIKIPKTHPRFNATIKNMEAVCANLYNVDAKKVKYCFEQGFSLGLSLDDCGYRFVAKCRNISNCLKAFAYVCTVFHAKTPSFQRYVPYSKRAIKFKGANVKPTIALKASTDSYKPSNSHPSRARNRHPSAG